MEGERSSSPLLEARHLGRRFHQGGHVVDAVQDVTFALGAGEVACVLGRSGSGKSTLLHLLGCLDRPSEGEVWLEGARVSHLGERERVAMRRTRLGFVFQSFNLLAHLSAVENVALPLQYAGVGVRQRTERAREALVQVGLEDRVDFPPEHLSGGEQQRVALARALVAVPPLVLADEPTGELDSATAGDMAELILRMRDRHGTAFLIVTHDEVLASRASRVFRMKDGRLAEPA